MTSNCIHISFSNVKIIQQGARLPPCTVSGTSWCWKKMFKVWCAYPLQIRRLTSNCIIVNPYIILAANSPKSRFFTEQDTGLSPYTVSGMSWCWKKVFKVWCAYQAMIHMPKADHLWAVVFSMNSYNILWRKKKTVPLKILWFSNPNIVLFVCLFVCLVFLRRASILGSPVWYFKERRAIDV